MKKMRIIALVLLAVIFTIKSYSQEGLTIHFGPSLPMADFASTSEDDEDTGGAGIGLNVGLKYVAPLTENGLGVFGGIDFNYNGLKGDAKDDFDQMFEGYNADIKYPKYINIPISAGLNYTYHADENFGVFANAGLVVNFLKITDTEVEIQNQTATLEMDLANGIGYKIGGGIIINPKTSISLDYFGLGNYDLKGETSAQGFSEESEGKLKVDFLNVTLGIKF